MTAPRLGDGSDEFDCALCGLHVNADEPDPCLGYLPGIEYACCGHGIDHPGPYFRFTNGVTVYFDGPVMAVTPACDTVMDDPVYGKLKAVRPWKAWLARLA